MQQRPPGESPGDRLACWAGNNPHPHLVSGIWKRDKAPGFILEILGSFPFSFPFELYFGGQREGIDYGGMGPVFHESRRFCNVLERKK